MDFNNGLILVSRNIILDDEQPKTKSEARKVLMLPKARDALWINLTLLDSNMILFS